MYHHNDLDKVRKIVGDNVKRAREANGLSQRQLASKLSFSSMTLSKVERGVSTTSPSNLREISAMLKIPYESLYSEDTSQYEMTQNIERSLENGDDLEGALALAEKLIEQAHQGVRKAWAYNLKARLHHKLGKYKSAINVWWDMLSEAISAKDNDSKFTATLNIAISHFNLKDYGQALSLTWSALDVCEDPAQRPKVMQLQANIYAEKGDFQEALRIHRDLLKCYEELDMRKYVLKSLHNIGDILTKLGDLDAAIQYLREARKLSFELFSNDEICKTSYDLAKALTMGGDIQEALHFLEEAVLVVGQKASPVNLSKIRFLLSDCIDDEAMKEHHLLCALDYALGTDELRLKGDIYHSLGELYDKMGDTMQALQYYKSASKTYRSVEVG
ncbi:helix-turn-helix transcriptional regulator [Tumebacillus sp. DT12]|uniref:Helix-turn-helix transcriptional regulator n=1 Tax=Tumebacillus lacus TaxID=2995335 RepID=A0ABT3X448_9BACL|nr:helix-turn-helix transcriptional regulator [Tumebacillus lacus]MCX7570355.1 helix-turn-helix transcriptional regulator [Tumebacillus lacus]